MTTASTTPRAHPESAHSVALHFYLAGWNGACLGVNATEHFQKALGSAPRPVLATQTCMTCKGSGEVIPAGRFIPCTECNGTGQTPTEMTADELDAARYRVMRNLENWFTHEDDLPYTSAGVDRAIDIIRNAKWTEKT